MVELAHVTGFARLMAISAKKTLIRGEFRSDGGFSSRGGNVVRLPDEMPTALREFLECARSKGSPPLSERTGGRDAGRAASMYAAPSQLHALCFAPSVEALSAPQIPVPLAGIVVTEESWTLLNPVRLGSHVEVSASVVSARCGVRGAELIVRGLVFDNDRLAYAEEVVYLAKKFKGSLREVGERWSFDSFDLRDKRGVNAQGYLDVGNRPSLDEREFTVADSRLWANYTGDINTIHMSGIVAKAFGYRQAILHGAAVEAWAMDSLGLDGSSECWGRAKFRAPALMPARLELVDIGSDSSDYTDYAVLDAKNGRDLVHLSYRSVGLSHHRDEQVFERARLSLPRVDGRVSSSAICQGMALAAGVGVPSFVERVRNTVQWRKSYRGAMTDLSRIDAPARGSEAARAGLAYLSTALHFDDGRPVGEARLSAVTEEPWRVTGEREPDRELCLEIDGREYRGHDLLALLETWQRDGFIRRGALVALSEVVHTPEILELDGWTFACLGASAELSPASSLLKWGATVAAPVRARREGNSALIEAARSGAGHLLLPPFPLDIVREPELVAGWICSLNGRIAMVDTLYAPGAQFLLAEAGADVVERLVIRERNDTALAWYGSPTDAYVLPELPHARFGSGAAASALALYAKLGSAAPARIDGVYPGYIDVQGPNYAAAKRIGRWRATVEREAGRIVSYNIGPLSMTRSVLVSRPLRAAYGGLRRLGIRPLPARASATLMAALLAWDLKNPQATAASETFLTDKALDCGLFSCPFEPNRLMGFAVALGADKAVVK